MLYDFIYHVYGTVPMIINNTCKRKHRSQQHTILQKVHKFKTHFFTLTQYLIVDRSKAVLLLWFSVLLVVDVGFGAVFTCR